MERACIHLRRFVLIIHNKNKHYFFNMQTGSVFLSTNKKPTISLCFLLIRESQI